MNYLTTLPLPYTLITTYCDKRTLDGPYDLRFFAAVLSSMAVAELMFYTGHRYMHQHWPERHLFHHCCTRSSYTTGYLFDPLDIAVEFSGPVLAVVGISLGIFGSPLALFYALTLVFAWYAADHDEMLKLPHWYHHKHINGNYTIYISTGYNDKADRVRQLVKRS
jgi:hypothetical protein